MSQATLVGYHGRKNLGDDIFLRIGCQWLQQEVRPTKIFVAGLQDSVPSSVEGCSATLVGYERRNAIFARTVWLRTFWHALSSTCVLFAAGSIFTIQPFLLAYILMRALRTLRPDVRLVAIGVSIGPLRTAFDRKWCGKLLTLFDYVLLRDEESARVLKELAPSCGFSVGFDLALGWPPAASITNLSEAAPFTVGICLNRSAYGHRTSAGENSDVFVAAMTAIKARIPGARAAALVVCTDPVDGDASTAQALAARLSDAGISCDIRVYEGASPERFLDSISACSCVITSRMHTGVLALMRGVPCFQISYARKISDFYERCGLDEENIAEPAGVNVDELVAFVIRVNAGLELERARARRDALLERGAAVRAALETAHSAGSAS